MHFRIGILGGSFDPIHSAHIAAAQTAIEKLSLDWVYLVPAGTPYHRNETLASAEERLHMTKLAIEGDPRLRVSDVDVLRSGNTYTIDTIRDLQKQFAATNPSDSAEWFLILGADAYAGLESWREPTDIASRVSLVVISRPGSEISEIAQYPATVIQIPGWDISSTEIRGKLLEDQSVDGLLPEVVIEYIHDNDLYSSKKRN